MGITDRVQVVGNLQLHIVRNTFILLDTRVQLVEVASLIVLLAVGTRRQRQQFAYHAEHTLHTFGERLYLFLSLEHRKLRGLHEASGNEMQTEVLLLVHLLGFDDPAYEFLYLWDKPYQDKGIHHIKRRMEGSQHEAQLGGIGQKSLCSCHFLGHVDIIADPPAHHVDEGTEHEQNPDNAEHVEEHMGQCRPTCLGIR